MHRDGRILDIWRRINGQTEDFFIPDDFEISRDELNSICIRAKNWRGPGGKTRKVTLAEYVERDPVDPSFEEVTKHYTVFEHSLDGTKAIHRHFLMLPTGAIVEIFDQFGTSSSRNTALQKLLAFDGGGGAVDGATTMSSVKGVSKKAPLAAIPHGGIFAGIEKTWAKKDDLPVLSVQTTSHHPQQQQQQPQQHQEQEQQQHQSLHQEQHHTQPQEQRQLEEAQWEQRDDEGSAEGVVEESVGEGIKEVVDEVPEGRTSLSPRN